MKKKSLLLTFLFLQSIVCLYAQVFLYSPDSILTIDSINDKTFQIRLVIDRSNDLLHNDTTFLFYLAEFPDHYSTEGQGKEPWVYFPFQLGVGNESNQRSTTGVRGISYAKPFEDVMKTEYRKLVMRAGKTGVKRIKVESGQKKELEFKLPIAPVLFYYSDFKRDKYEGLRQDRENFSLFITYGLTFHMNPIFSALEKYDTNKKRKTVVYKDDLACPKIRIDFK